MADLIRMHCLHCRQTYLTGPDAQQCDLCRKEGGMVTPEAALEIASQVPEGPPSPPRRPPGGYPISRACPECGSEAFRSVRPDRLVSFGWDRVCKGCGARYTPPTPAWGAAALIGVGLILLAIAGVGALLSVMGGDVLGIVCVGIVGLLGALAVVQGVRGAGHSVHASGPPSREAETEQTPEES